jgi:hypothetical protein
MVHDHPPGLIECVNVPATISTIISCDMNLATLHDLDTHYGVEDMWRLLEVITVHNYNQKLMNKRSES